MRRRKSILANGTVVYSDLLVGTHSVALGQIASNCAVAGSNPRSAAVTEGAITDVGFDVTCEELPRGTLEVTTSVTNNFDPDGFGVLVDGKPVGEVDVDSSASLVVPAGSIAVELDGIAPNCAVQGEHPRGVDLGEGESRSVLFEIRCESPADGRIVVIGRPPSIPSGSWGVSIMNSDGSGRFFVFDCKAVCLRPRWSPDGSEIVFAWPDQNESVRHLHLISKDGRSVRQITAGRHVDGFAAWSPDAAWIVFARLDSDNLGTPGDRPWRLFKVRSDGTELTQFPVPPDGVADLEPHWSPDGSKIVFVRKGESTDTGELVEMLMTISPDGTALDTIVPNSPVLPSGEPEYYDRSPAWSPDGSRIAFDRRMHSGLDPSGRSRSATATRDRSVMPAGGTLLPGSCLISPLPAPGSRAPRAGRRTTSDRCRRARRR